MLFTQFVFLLLTLMCVSLLYPSVFSGGAETVGVIYAKILIM